MVTLLFSSIYVLNDMWCVGWIAGKRKLIKSLSVSAIFLNTIFFFIRVVFYENEGIIFYKTSI